MADETSGTDRTYDVVVIGAGPVGENVADRAHQGGLSACVVEKHLVGGECSYYACMPSKALLRPVQLVAASARVRGVGAATIQPQEVLRRRDGFVSNLDDAGQVEWLASAGIDLVRGNGRLAGVRRVAVDAPDGTQTTIRARHAVVLAVGTVANVPPIEGLADAHVWTNREATTADHVPDSLVVLGGGVVACELAQAYAGLGSQVTLLERGERLLARTEEFAGEYVAHALADAGVDLRLGATVTAVTRLGDGRVRATLADGTYVVAAEALNALGRRPTTDDLGVESVGLEPGTYVAVDDSLCATGVDGGWLYAAGDANGRNLLTHMGKYQARVCGDVIAARAAGRRDDLPSMRASADAVGAPQVIFTDPEVGAVGRTEAAARDAGITVRAVDVDLGSVAGASLHADGYRGRARMVVDDDRRIVVGATFVGQDIAELVHSATVAVIGEVPLDTLWHAVPAYPTISEVWLRLLEAYGL